MKWLDRAGYGYTTFYPKGTYPLDQLRITFDHQMRYSTLRYAVPLSMNDKLHAPDGYRNCGILYSCFNDHPSDGRVIAIIRVDGNIGLFGKPLYAIFLLTSRIVEILCGAWGSSDLPTDPESLEAYIASFNTTLDEPVPAYVMEILSRFKDESVPFTHDAVRSRTCLLSIQRLKLTFFI